MVIEKGNFVMFLVMRKELQYGTNLAIERFFREKKNRTIDML